jgi:hypothetical protein
MHTNSINNLASSYLQSVLGTAAASTKTSSTSAAAPATQSPSDSGRLSPFAQLMTTLQQLQKSDPAEYQQVTAQIATGLQTAAKTATSAGNTSAASQLTQLAADFTTASKSGQPLNMPNVAKAMSGGHHHHHESDSDATSTSSSTASTASTSSSSSLNQFLASLQSSSSQDESLDPTSIIANALSNAGITSNVTG